MQTVTVHLRNARIAPRKTRLVADLIRNKTVLQAQSILEFTINRPATPLLKLLNSGVAAANQKKMDEKRLVVSKVTVDGGPTLKRSFPMSRGRAYPIMKRTSHVTLMLSEIPDQKPSDSPDRKGAKKETKIQKEIRPKTKRSKS